MKPSLALGLLTVVLASAAPSQEAPLDMIPVKYDALKQEVLKHRGKVVIVDFWAGY
jgi:hypothetical protein